jgi:hypothetical protein
LRQRKREIGVGVEKARSIMRRLQAMVADPELASRPIRTTADERSSATEVTENTEVRVFSHLNATRLK